MIARKKILGLRMNSEKPRYALVQYENKAFELLNSETESQLIIPTEMNKLEAKAEWVYRELERIYNDHPDISLVCIKTNEYGLTEKRVMRETSYLDGITLLFCCQKNLPVLVKTYKSSATTGREALEHAEQRVGRTSKYWNIKMADAIIAAWHGAKF